MIKLLIPLSFSLFVTVAVAQNATPTPPPPAGPPPTPVQPSLNLDPDKANMKLQIGQLMQVIGQYELRMIDLQKQVDDAKMAHLPPHPVEQKP